MKSSRFLTGLASILVLTACGGSSSSGQTTTTTTATTSTDTTSGGETRAADHPLRSTTPIPVPATAVAREDMSAPLQALWDQVERTAELRPPEPPSDRTVEAIQAWIDGPFRAWLDQRVQMSVEAEAQLEPLRGAPSHERGIAAGLLGYLHEDTAADVRGAPIPEAIDHDPELLREFSEALNEALHPYARRSALAYGLCERAFDEAPDSAWAEWGEYCDDRREEVMQVFHLTEEDANPDAFEGGDSLDHD